MHFSWWGWACQLLKSYGNAPLQDNLSNKSLIAVSVYYFPRWKSEWLAMFRTLRTSVPSQQSLGTPASWFWSHITHKWLSSIPKIISCKYQMVWLCHWPKPTTKLTMMAPQEYIHLPMKIALDWSTSNSLAPLVCEGEPFLLHLGSRNLLTFVSWNNARKLHRSTWN